MSKDILDSIRDVTCDDINDSDMCFVETRIEESVLNFITQSIRDSRQRFYDKRMHEAQNSFIGLFCSKLGIDVNQTLTGDVDKD